MSIYELPDGFWGMDSLPRGETVNLVTVQGRFTNGHWDSGDPVSDVFIGWSPVVPPKKKRRFKADWCSIRKCWTVRYNPPTVTLAACLDGLSQDTPEHRNAAQAVADIYEQAYEVTK